MFTVIELPLGEHGRAPFKVPLRRWAVWCGWQDRISAVWYSLDEACRDAALKEWTYQRATKSAV